MLTGLVLENFKTFGGAHAIPLAPLTVIYGANSSGKSSILQALLFLKQNVHLGTNPTAQVVLSGPIVDLDCYSQVVYKHNTKLSVSVAPLIELPQIGHWNEGPTGPLGEPNSRHAGFGFSFGLNINGDLRVLGRPVYWSLVRRPAFVWPTEENVLEANLPYEGLIDYESSYWSWLESKHYLRTYVAAADYFEAYRNALVHLNEPTYPKNYPSRALQAFRFGFHDILIIDAAFPGVYRDGTVKTCIHVFDDIFQSNLVRRHEKGASTKDLILELNALIERSSRELTFEERVRDFIDFSRLLRNNVYVMTQTKENDALRGSEEWAEYRSRYHSNLIGDTDDLFYETLPHADTLPMGVWSDTLSFIEGITHVGPLRIVPDRIGSRADQTVKTVGKDGQSLEAVLFANPVLVSQVNFWLSELDISHRVSTIMFDRSKTFGKILITDILSKATGSLHDVGFGVSQILPVIVELLLPGAGPVLIEQPELHLHPAAQARLALLLNEARQRRQVIIETHSEHLLLGLQRLIQDGDAPASDVCVLRVTKQRTGSHVQRMEVADDGNFEEPWLHGFFPDPVATRYGDAV